MYLRADGTYLIPQKMNETGDSSPVFFDYKN